MTTDVIMPKIGFSMQEATITEWHVPDGGAAVEGAILYSIESEKSIVEIESPASGTLRIQQPVGATSQVGDVLAVIEQVV